ncbi:glycosyltransferase family 4 protein [Anaerosacchariphilus polymeriproducens]|uniref:Glycosyltransferase n=1 Tax=Anaerosacchariphilus polymeriproducens TaxID=1812858 RepID=A0A371AYW7_9FIRM|nr:glycosyltransferase family 4 protein [Anaerosacchariphilus polymeriproducens]RDU24788.1 glycosyltransferase [Anaerosacchariphilus polymeriproducens]
MRDKKKNGKIKICFVLPGTYQLFNRVEFMAHGGAELNMYYLSKMFAEDERFEVAFITEDQNQKHIEYYDNVKVIKLGGLKWGATVISGNPLKKILCRFQVELSAAREMLFSDYDVVITTTANIMIARLVFWGKMFTKKKAIFRLANDTDADPHYFASTGGSKLKDKLYWWGVTHADELIFQTKQQMKIFNETEDRTGTIIENGFYIQNPEINLRKKDILWVSRADEVKRPHLLLEMAKRLPEEHFVMVMPGKNELSKKIQKDLENISNIEFIEYVPFEEIMELFYKAKLFVNTATFEGFPNTFIQSAMAQTPILSYCINPDGILDEYNMGYVCQESVDKAVEFIRNMDESKRKEMGDNAFSYVKQKHDIHNTRAAYEKLILKLYNQKGK